MKVYVVESFDPGRYSYVFDSVFDSEQKAKEYCDKYNKIHPQPKEEGDDYIYSEVELE